MSETGFIRVLLNNPHYKGRKCRGLIRLSDGVTVVPIYAEPAEDGTLWASPFDNPKAKAVSLLLTTPYGTFITADMPGMVELIGKSTVEEIFGVSLKEPPEGPFGFASAIGSKEIPPDR